MEWVILAVIVLLFCAAGVIAYGEWRWVAGKRAGAKRAIEALASVPVAGQVIDIPMMGEIFVMGDDRDEETGEKYTVYIPTSRLVKDDGTVGTPHDFPQDYVDNYAVGVKTQNLAAKIAASEGEAFYRSGRL